MPYNKPSQKDLFQKKSIKWRIGSELGPASMNVKVLQDHVDQDSSHRHIHPDGKGPFGNAPVLLVEFPNREPKGEED